MRFLDNFSAGNRGSSSAEYPNTHPYNTVCLCHKNRSKISYANVYCYFKSILEGFLLIILLLLFVRLYSNYTLTTFVLRYFLLSGYAVIFMHREKSLFPFLRHFQHQNILEWFTVNNDQASIQCKCVVSCLNMR